MQSGAILFSTENIKNKKNMDIKTFHKYKGQWREKYMSPNELFNIIKEEKYKDLCEKLQWKLNTTINLPREAIIEDAEKLPIITFGISNQNKITGYILLSFKCKDQKMATSMIKTASLSPQTVMSFTGSSRRSVKIVVASTLPDGTLPAIDDEANGKIGKSAVYFYQHAYFKAAQYYKGQIGKELESKHPRIDKGCRMSSDKGAFFNDNVIPMIIEQPVGPLTDTIRKNPNTDVGRRDLFTLPGYDEVMMDIAKYHTCYSNVVEEGHEEIDDFVTSLAEQCRRNGISKEFAIKHLLRTAPYSTYEYIVRKCFEIVYIKGTPAREMNAIPQIALQMAHLRDFLENRYHFRRNEITGTVEYYEEGKNMFDWEQLTTERLNSITLDAQEEGIPIWDKDVKRYVDSARVASYNPINEYMDSLPEWDHTDRVTELSKRVPTLNKDWTRNFHTWLLSMVSQWTNRNPIHASTMVPLIIGKQGDGKSTFCRLILPEELRLYYIDRLDFTNKNDAEKALTRFALINIDEYDSISKRQTAFLKHILQKCSVMQRELYQSVIAERKRIASFIATTNDQTPLADATGSRRYLCIQTDGIINTNTPIDYDQLYAQIKYELSSGMKSYFTNEEEIKIQEQNADYQRYDTLFEIFNEFFAKPEESNEGIFMTTAAILHALHSRYNLVKEDNSNAIKLGTLIKTLHLEKKHTNIGNVYKVVMK
jgi:hypothetical protein